MFSAPFTILPCNDSISARFHGSGLTGAALALAGHPGSPWAALGVLGEPRIAPSLLWVPSWKCLRIPPAAGRDPGSPGPFPAGFARAAGAGTLRVGCAGLPGRSRPRGTGAARSRSAPGRPERVPVTPGAPG